MEYSRSNTKELESFLTDHKRLLQDELRVFKSSFDAQNYETMKQNYNTFKANEPSKNVNFKLKIRF